MSEPTYPTYGGIAMSCDGLSTGPTYIAIPEDDLKQLRAKAAQRDALAQENKRLMGALERAKDSLWNYGCTRAAEAAEKAIAAAKGRP